MQSLPRIWQDAIITILQLQSKQKYKQEHADLAVQIKIITAVRGKQV